MGKVNNVLCGPKYKTPTELLLEQGPAHNETTQIKKKDVHRHLCTQHSQREKGMAQDP
jgi:hypothetical protein